MTKIDKTEQGKIQDKGENVHPMVEKHKKKGKEAAGEKSLQFSFMLDKCEVCKKIVEN